MVGEKIQKGRDLLALGTVIGSLAAVGAGCGESNIKPHYVRFTDKTVSYKDGTRQINIDQANYYEDSVGDEGRETFADITQACVAGELVTIIRTEDDRYHVVDTGLLDGLQTKTDPTVSVRTLYQRFKGCDDGRLTSSDFPASHNS